MDKKKASAKQIKPSLKSPKTPTASASEPEGESESDSGDVTGGASEGNLQGKKKTLNRETKIKIIAKSGKLKSIKVADVAVEVDDSEPEVEYDWPEDAEPSETSLQTSTKSPSKTKDEPKPDEKGKPSKKRKKVKSKDEKSKAKVRISPKSEPEATTTDSDWESDSGSESSMTSLDTAQAVQHHEHSHEHHTERRQSIFNAHEGEHVHHEHVHDQTYFENKVEKVKRRRQRILRGTYTQYFEIRELNQALYSSSGFTTSSTSFNSNDSQGHPDMEWLDIGSSEEEDQKVEDDNHRFAPLPKKDDSRYNLIYFLTPYFMTNKFLGRQPFSFSMSHETGLPICTFKRKTGRFALFCLSSFIFLLLLGMVLFSISDIMTATVSPTDSYSNLERLLIQKWWLPLMIFTLTLLLTVIGSFSLIRSGDEFADYLTKWIKLNTKLDYDIHSRCIFYISWAHPAITAFSILVTLTLYFFDVCKYREYIEAVTVILFRNFFKDIGLNRKLIPILGSIVVVMQLYIYFCARSLVIIFVIFCRGVMYLAHVWNNRLCILLRGDPYPNDVSEERLKILKSKIRFGNMFKEHTHIVSLVRGLSAGVFATVIITYSVLETTSVAFTIFESTKSFFFDLKYQDLNETHIKGTDVSYDKSKGEGFFEVTYYFAIIGTGLALSCWSASGAGEMVMYGNEIIRRYGLVLAKSATERQFIFSMQISFNGASPHVIKPSDYFLFHREFITGVFGGIVMLFSILIQFQIVRLVDVPIIFTCFDDNGLATVCVKTESRNVPVSSVKIDPLDNLKLLSGDERRSVSGETIDNLLEESRENLKDIATLPDVDGPGFLHIFNLNETELNRRCLRYCKGTFISRVVAFNNKGERYPLPLDDITNCIVKPYKDIKEDKIYNCLEVLADEKDTCGMPNLSKDFLSMKTPTMKTIYYNNRTEKVTCFYDKERKLTFGKIESCRLPVSGIGPACRNKPLKTAFYPWTPFMTNPNKPPVKLKKGPMCNIKKMTPDTVTKSDDSYEIKKGFVTRFEVEINGKNYSVLKNVGINTFHFFKDYDDDTQEILISFPPNPIDKLFRPYAYFHPKTLDSGSKPNPINTFGYFDCFGEPLIDFDDCGNLGFSLVIAGKTAYEIQTTKITETSASGKTYQCWKSKFPSYKCGVPEEIMDETCRLWKEYYDNPPS